MNDFIKGDCGVIGIRDNHSALIKWITAGPEISRNVSEFENPTFTKGMHCSQSKQRSQVM